MGKIVFLLLLFVGILSSSASAFGFGTPLLSHAIRHAAPSSRGSHNLVMRERACDLLGKKANRKALAQTFSNKKSHKVQQVNLQWKRLYSDLLKREIRIRLSTKGIKTINKYGSVDKAAKKFGVDLSKF
mmetsp:Transcript_15928/g.22772  ORF Transcript_15928/g.22772 Transcript_15928/m.22772 type:complete len:129 (-) Transcript_15928:205-591(-)